MKKFVFTNEKYYNIKLKDFDNLKRDMENVEKAISAARLAITQLELRFDEHRQNQIRACQTGTSSTELRNYQSFFPYLREKIKNAIDEADMLEEKKRIIRSKLIRLHNEIKVLEGMKEEQYAEYLKEAALEQAVEMDQFMSFTIYEGAK